MEGLTDSSVGPFKYQAVNGDRLGGMVGCWIAPPVPVDRSIAGIVIDPIGFMQAAVLFRLYLIAQQRMNEAEVEMGSCVLRIELQGFLEPVLRFL